MWKQISSSFVIGLVIALFFVSEAAGQTSTLATKWKPPKDWYRKFPYYISGFDFEGRPVLIVEYGKWNIRSKMAAGPESAKAMMNYFHQLTQDHILLGESFQDVEGVTVVVDFEGFDYASLTHGPTLLFLFNSFGHHGNHYAEVLNQGLGINVNFAAERFFSVAAHVLGSVLAKFDMLGTNKERWGPKLRSVIPANQLPKWYTGSRKDWKPLQVLGRGEIPDIEMLRRERAKIRNVVNYRN